MFFFKFPQHQHDIGVYFQALFSFWRCTEKARKPKEAPYSKQDGSQVFGSPTRHLRTQEDKERLRGYVGANAKDLKDRWQGQVAS